MSPFWWMVGIVGTLAIVIVPTLIWRWQQSRYYQPPCPYVDDAARFIWVELMHMEAKSRPRLFWVRVDDKRAARRKLSDGTEEIIPGPYWTDLWGRKVAGHSHALANAVTIGWRVDGTEPTKRLTQTSLVHEFGHCAWERRGMSNQAHPPEFLEFCIGVNEKLGAWEETRARTEAPTPQPKKVT